MAKESAGLLIFRNRGGRLEVLLVHPGGPLWKNKDDGAWTIPKGEIQPGEDPLAAAQREVHEELGWVATGRFFPLNPVKQKGGKVVQAWAVESDWDTTTLKSNTFATAWPPGSHKLQHFPEVDRAEYFEIETARRKINPAQVAFLEQLGRELAG